MPFDKGEIYKSLVNHTPYLIVHPSEVDWFMRELPGVFIKPYETVPLQIDTINRIPRNRHERRKSKKLRHP